MEMWDKRFSVYPQFKSGVMIMGFAFPDDPNRDRDFCENQVELITDVCGSVEKVFRQLDDLHCRTVLEI